MTANVPAAALAATHFASFGPDAAWDEATFAAYQNKSFHWVIGDATCFAVLKVIAGEAEILTLATHPDARREGRARALLVGVLREMKLAQVTHIFLDVAEDNVAARALYHEAGFEDFSTRPKYYASGVDAICMNRRL